MRKASWSYKMYWQKKVLFVFDLKNTYNWKDGLYMALKLLEKDFDITYWNLSLLRKFPIALKHFDFILGWSSFDGEIAYLMRNIKQKGKYTLTTSEAS